LFERTDIRGAVTIELSDRSGAVIHRQQRDNRIVLTGRQLVARLFGGPPLSASPPPAGTPAVPAATRVTHVGVGTNAGAVTDAQSALLAERPGRAAIVEVAYADFDEGTAAAVVRRTRVSLSAVFDFNQAIGTGGTNPPLREAALFTASGATGVMYNRVTFDPVTKTNAFRLTLLWDIVF
jgi:hypothetical protein